MSMYNYYSQHLFNRYATTMQHAFGQAPCAQVGPPLGGRRLAVLTDKPSETGAELHRAGTGRCGRASRSRPPPTIIRSPTC